MTFEEKALSLKPSEVVRECIVNSLLNHSLKVNMNTFGHSEIQLVFDKEKGEMVEKTFCFGCAATNAVCLLSGKVFDSTNINSTKDRSAFVETSENFLDCFEKAINELRCGDIEAYNDNASKIGMAQIPLIENGLPILKSSIYLEHLPEYEKFAERLEELEMAVRRFTW